MNRKPMEHSLRAEVLRRLQDQYGLKPMAGTQCLRKGTCPNCGKKELYSRQDEPWSIKCGRESKCGEQWHIKELSDDLFDDYSTREEITAILGQQTERHQEINLTEFMIWTGPRVSEAIALAWEDVDLVAGTVEIRRARVAGQYKVTKTRRSTRKVKLLAPALRALKAQARYTLDLPPELIEVVDRDNRTMRKQRVRFVEVMLLSPLFR